MPKLLYARTPENAEEERKVHKLAGSRHAPGDWIFRARIVSLSWQGLRTAKIAQRLGCHPKTVTEKAPPSLQRLRDRRPRRPPRHWPQAPHRPAKGERAGTIVATPLPPYRETTLVLRYDTQDVVRPVEGLLACELRAQPATSPILGKLRFAVRHEAGWTFAPTSSRPPSFR